MSDLTDAIDVFLAKYPADAPLEWRGRKRPSGLDQIVADLITASERHRAIRDTP